MTAIPAALAGIPSLPGAACRGLSWMGDLGAASPADDVATAKSICASCPARPDCKAWVDSLPPHQRPAGVVAGELIEPPTAAVTQRAPTDPDADDRWLVAHLAEHGPTDASRVMAAGRVAGIAAARLRSARKRVAELRWSGGGRAVWSLPDNDDAVVAS